MSKQKRRKAVTNVGYKSKSNYSSWFTVNGCRVYKFRGVFSLITNNNGRLVGLWVVDI